MHLLKNRANQELDKETIITKDTRNRFISFLEYFSVHSVFMFFLLFCIVTTWGIKATAKQGADLQQGIAEDIIRFHVIANSDSPQDQALKLEVKASLVESLSPILSNAENKSEARDLINHNLENIRMVAEETIRQKGYDYPVTVSLSECYFPMKIYGDYTFPPGKYEALQVQIGLAKGKNWWCVMFPPLCFVDETYSIVDEDSKEKLKHVLTEEEYKSLTSRKTPVKVKFKLWKSIKKLFS